MRSGDAPGGRPACRESIGGPHCAFPRFGLPCLKTILLWASRRRSRRGARSNGNVAAAQINLQTVKWEASDFALAGDGKLPQGKPAEQWSYGDIEAGFKAAKLVIGESFVSGGLAHHQIRGGNVMGIGLAMFERHVYDPELGLPAKVPLCQSKPSGRAEGDRMGRGGQARPAESRRRQPPPLVGTRPSAAPQDEVRGCSSDELNETKPDPDKPARGRRNSFPRVRQELFARRCVNRRRRLLGAGFSSEQDSSEPAGRASGVAAHALYTSASGFAAGHEHFTSPVHHSIRRRQRKERRNGGGRRQQLCQPSGRLCAPFRLPAPRRARGDPRRGARGGRMLGRHPVRHQASRRHLDASPCGGGWRQWRERGVARVRPPGRAHRRGQRAVAPRRFHRPLGVRRRHRRPAPRSVPPPHRPCTGIFRGAHAGHSREPRHRHVECGVFRREHVRVERAAALCRRSAPSASPWPPC